MKVLQIIPSADLRGGGPIEGVLRIGEVMAGLGVKQELLTLDPPDAPWLDQCGQIVHALGEPYPEGDHVLSRVRRWARYSPRALAWARDHINEYDAVVVNGLWNYATRLARVALVGSGIPYVVYTHGMLDPWFRKRYPQKHLAKQLLWFFNEGVLLRHADRVLFTCEQERNLARETFFPYRANEHVIAFGAAIPQQPTDADVAAFRAMLPALGDRRYLLFLSRIHEKKGCDLLIEAFAREAGRDPGLDLVIAGPDDSDLRNGLEARAAELGIAERIHWPGMVVGGPKFGALLGAEAFILPSHQENFGIAVAEALACECPVLISDQVNIWREIVAAGGGFAEPDTVTGAEALISRFLALDTSARAEMRKRARKVFEDRFDMAQGARELADVLKEISRK